MDKIFRRVMNAGKVSADDVLRDPKWPKEFPFSERDFQRGDESDDAYFYAQPRIGVFHIDEWAVRALTRYYSATLPPSADILDLCSSWVSHLPSDYKEKSLTILGMSTAELDANTRATRRVVQDLNRNPSLPFQDASFDIITNAVSVEYVRRCIPKCFPLFSTVARAKLCIRHTSDRPQSQMSTSRVRRRVSPNTRNGNCARQLSVAAT